MKKQVIICIIMLLIILLVFIGVKIFNKEDKEQPSIPISYNNENDNSEEINQKIEGIILDKGLQGSKDLYKIADEDSKNNVLTIKPEVQFNVVMAGILKNNQQPDVEEIVQTLANAPTNYGIWIEENSREKFLSILSSITFADYTITEDGYLVQEEKFFMNRYDRKIRKMISSNYLYIIDISSLFYILDDITAEVTEYPFEDMEPHTPYQYFEAENKKIFMISQNNYGKIKQEEALKEILNNE